MFDIFTQFATDETKENDGVWHYLGVKGDDQPALLIARSGNRKYNRLLNKLVESHQVTLDAKNEASEQLDSEIMTQVLASTVLLGWKNLHFKGQAVPDYSVEEAKKLLAVKDFRAHVAKLAAEVDRYKCVQEAEAVKN